MSLLNDALRKQKNEQLPESRRAAQSVFRQIRSQGRRKRYQTAAMVAAIAIAAIIVAWWFRPPAQEAARPFIAPVTADQDDEAPAAAAMTNSPMDPGLQQENPTTIVETPGAPSSVAMPQTGTGAGHIETPGGDGDPPPVNKSGSAEALPLPPDRKADPSPEDRPHPARTATAAPALKPEKPTPEPAVTARARPATRSAGVDRLYQKALTYHRQGRMAEAIAMYREVLKIDPDHFDTGFNLTSAYLQAEAFDKAYAMASELYRRVPANPRVALNFAIALIGCGQPAQALELLDKINEMPYSPRYEIYFHKGVAYRNLDQPEQAVVWYKKAESLKGDDPRLLFNLAVALDQLQHYDQAVIYYRGYLKASKTLDPLMRKQIGQRIRALQNDLAAYPQEERAE